MRFARSSLALLVCALIASTAEAEPAATDAEAWRVANCTVIDAVVATLPPGSVKQDQSENSYRTFDDGKPALYTQLTEPRLRNSRTVRCPSLPDYPPGAAGVAAYQSPLWSGDYRRVLVDINTTKGWFSYLMERDGDGWRVVEQRRLHIHWTVDEVT